MPHYIGQIAFFLIVGIASFLLYQRISRIRQNILLGRGN